MSIIEAMAEDSYTTFDSVKKWKAETVGLALGYFPVYFPPELAHAMGFLPVGLLGASGRVNLDMATARTQSFVCSISRSVFQLGLQGNLDVFDALVFSNICDVARNLSGILKRNLKSKHIEYIHFPINNNTHAVQYLREEYARVIGGLAKLTGEQPSREKLRESIKLYNRRRNLQCLFASLREEKPWILPYEEFYNLLRAGEMMPAELYNRELEVQLEEIRRRQAKPMDKIRVIMMGNFCEQPPLQLMKTIEDGGCYIIRDEALIGQHWLGQVEEKDEDPLSSLARAYVLNNEPLTVRYHSGVDKQKYIMNLVRASKAEGVIFCTPKFCEPALYDYMIYKTVLEKSGVPNLHVEYEETGSSFEHTRTMVETYAESILFD